MKAIENNMSNITSTDRENSFLNEIQKDKSNYKFDPNKTKETENGNELDVLMKAYDSDYQSAKKKNN